MSNHEMEYFDVEQDCWVNFDPYILSQEVLVDRGSLKRVRQYASGHHPLLGKLHEGWSGPETIIEKDVVAPLGVFGTDNTSCQRIYHQSRRPL